MVLDTSRFGRIEVDDEKIIRFPEGLIGFQDKKCFLILPHRPGSPFRWLQSVDDGNLAFIIIKPEAFVPDYRPALSREERTFFRFDSEEEAVVYAIVVVPSDPRKMSANLLGPLIINPKLKIGKQVVLSSREYSTCHYIVEEILKNAGSVTQAE